MSILTKSSQSCIHQNEDYSQYLTSSLMIIFSMKAILLSLGMSICVLSSFSQSSFTMTKTGTTPTIDAAIDFTGTIWSQYLNSTIPIKVNVIYTDLSAAGPLATTLPNGELDFVGAPFNGWWYASSLANSIASNELNIGEFDMDIYVNSSVNYYFGLDGLPGPGQYDFITVFMHEIAHGLGAMSLTKYDVGVGSFGTIDATSILPLVTSFPFPVLGGLPSIWDYFLVNGSSQQLANTLIFPNLSTALGTEFQSNDIFFTGPATVLENGGTSAQIFAPATFEGGSSLQHFDEAIFTPASGNGLLTPYLTNNEVQHTPGPLLMAALTDIGWSVNAPVGIKESNLAAISVSPNPSNGFVQIAFDGTSVDLQLIDLLGNVLVPSLNSGANDLNALPNGTYLIIGTLDQVPVNESLVLMH
ncbi:MAG: hypothetical protein ACI837_000030 [Crocinitomicaceae bacterium]|jgi:hypothetical protein